MEEERPGMPLRFIKKVAQSAGPTTYKLSLNHQIVEKSLQHLVNTDFELASSASTSQTWQGRISARRNKDRKEYILQGWKLFSEAHKIRPGDQISIELAGPKRLVIQVILPEEIETEKPAAIRRKAPESSESAERQPPKTPRTSACSSPTRQTENGFMLDQHSGGGVKSSLRSLPAASLPKSASMNSLSIPTPPQSLQMANNVNSWFSTMNLGSPHTPLGTTASSQLVDKEALAVSLTPTVVPKTEPMEDGGGDDLLSFLEGHLPGVFDNVCEDIDSIVPDVPSSNGLAVGEGSMLGSLQSSMGTKQSTRLCLGDGPVLGSLQSSMGRTHFTEQASQEETRVHEREVELRGLVNSIQDRLDNCTRSALHATMDLEHCIVDLSNPGVSHRKAQANMFKHLSLLKESLWQIMLVTK